MSKVKLSKLEQKIIQKITEKQFYAVPMSGKPRMSVSVEDVTEIISQVISEYIKEE